MQIPCRCFIHFWFFSRSAIWVFYLPCASEHAESSYNHSFYATLLILTSVSVLQIQFQLVDFLLVMVHIFPLLVPVNLLGCQALWSYLIGRCIFLYSYKYSSTFSGMCVSYLEIAWSVWESSPYNSGVESEQYLQVSLFCTAGLDLPWGYIHCPAIVGVLHYSWRNRHYCWPCKRQVLSSIFTLVSVTALMRFPELFFITVSPLNCHCLSLPGFSVPSAQLGSLSESHWILPPYTVVWKFCQCCEWA